MNEYYILPTGMLNVLDNYDVVETLETVRYNLNGTKFVCKTRSGVTNPPFMNPHTAKTHSEVLVEMAKAEWTTNE